MFCAHCGEELDNDAKFCAKCGTQTENSVNKKASPQEELVAERSVVSNSASKVAAMRIAHGLLGIISFLILYTILRIVLNPGSNSTSTNLSAFRSSFIQSCTKTAGTAGATYCPCLADYMFAKYSISQLQNLSAKIKPGAIVPQELVDGAASCITEAEYRANFMNACTPNGAQNATCSCALTYLSNNYSLAQRLRMDLDYKSTNQLPQAATDALTACAPASK